MNLPIKNTLTAVLALLISYSPTPAVAVPQNNSHRLTVAQSPQFTDTLIIPGERVGPITRTTTRKDLVKLFGATHLVDKTISGAEGIGSFAATQVNLSRGRSLLVVWSDRSRTKPLNIHNLGTAWKTPEGIGVGITLSELRRKLGNFKLYGLGWDYGGTIVLKSSRLSRYENKLILQVDTAPNASQKYPQDYQALLGDRTFSSSDRHWKPLGVRLTAITVLLNPEQ